MVKRIAAILLFAALAALSAGVLCAEQPAGYKLAWADEFGGATLDSSRWGYRTDSKHWSTQKPENVTVADGVLKLNVKKEKAGDKEYTGAGVISKKTFKYGYYESCFKIPAGAGWHTRSEDTRLNSSHRL